MPRLSAPHEHLQRRLIDARRALKLSQKDVATQWGVPQQRISRIETGERRLDLVELVVLASILKIDPHEVIDELRSALRVKPAQRRR